MPEYNAQNFYQAVDLEFKLVVARLASLGVKLNLDRGEVVRVMEESAITLQSEIQKLKLQNEEDKKSLPPQEHIVNDAYGTHTIRSRNGYGEWAMRQLKPDLRPTFPEGRELSAGDQSWLE